MGCGITMIKYLLFIFNLVFALSGLALLVIGVLYVTDFGSYSDFVQGNVSAPPIVTIVLGSIIFVVAFFGCCGAIRESHCMVVTFAILLLTIFIAQVAIAGVAFANTDVTESVVDDKIMEFVKNYTTSEDSRKIMDIIQTDLKCCGAKGPSDYINLPSSCCVNNDKCANVGDERLHYTMGCQEALKIFLKNAAIVVGGVAIGVAAVELVGVIFALCLANSIRNESRRGR